MAFASSRDHCLWTAALTTTIDRCVPDKVPNPVSVPEELNQRMRVFDTPSTTTVLPRPYLMVASASLLSFSEPILRRADAANQYVEQLLGRDATESKGEDEGQERGAAQGTAARKEPKKVTDKGQPLRIEAGGSLRTRLRSSVEVQQRLDDQQEIAIQLSQITASLHGAREVTVDDQIAAQFHDGVVHLVSVKATRTYYLSRANPFLTAYVNPAIARMQNVVSEEGIALPEWETLVSPWPFITGSKAFLIHNSVAVFSFFFCVL